MRSRKVTKTIRFSEATTFARLNAMALVGMRGAAKRLNDADRERAIESIAREGLGPFARRCGA